MFRPLRDQREICAQCSNTFGFCLYYKALLTLLLGIFAKSHWNSLDFPYLGSSHSKQLSVISESGFRFYAVIGYLLHPGDSPMYMLPV